MKHIKLYEEFIKENNNESSELDEALNELSMSSVGVRSFLRAMYTNADVIKKLGFKSFKDLVAYVKTNDLQEWDELRAEVEELGIVIAESEDFTNEKIEYPEGVKTTDDKILDKVAKLLHSPKGIIEIGSGSVRGKKIPFQTDDSTYFNITGQKDHYVLLCKNGEFEIPRNEIKNAEELYDQIEKAIQMGTITKGKLKS